MLARHGENYIYLVVFVGGVVLEKDDALTVQTPVVPLSLLGSGWMGWDIKGWRENRGGGMGQGQRGHIFKFSGDSKEEEKRGRMRRRTRRSASCRIKK